MMMEYLVKYEPERKASPWSVYMIAGEEEVFERGFTTRESANRWVYGKTGLDGEHPAKRLDKVDKAARDSFPASDPPSWTGTTATKH